jgi:hypothetical protein
MLEYLSFTSELLVGVGFQLTESSQLSLQIGNLTQKLFNLLQGSFLFSTDTLKGSLEFSSKEE